MSANNQYDPWATQAGAPAPQMPYGAPTTPGPMQYPPMQYPSQMGMRPQEHPQATVVLVLGIVGLFTAILAPIAWFLGNKATKEVKAGTYSMTDSLKIGRILGIVGTILLIVGLVIALVLVIFTIILAAMAASY